MCKALWIILGVIPLAVSAQQLPQRKPGLWELRAVDEGKPGAGPASEQCVNAESDRQMQQRAFGGADARCEQKLARKVKGGWDLESTCKQPGGLAHTRLELRGDMNRAYVIHSVTRYEPPRRHLAQAQMTLKATWKGDCPAGMAPGQTRAVGGPAGGPGVPAPAAAPPPASPAPTQ